MLYDIAHFWVSLLIAIALGCGFRSTQALARRSENQVRSGERLLPLSAVIFVVGLVLALVRVVPGRPGLWLETALLLFAAYFVGHAVPGLLAFKTASARRPVSTFETAHPQAVRGQAVGSSGASGPPRHGRGGLSAAAIASVSALLLAAAFLRRRFGSSGRRPPS